MSGVSPKTCNAYRPRAPVLFYPPEGFTVVLLTETFESSEKAHRCLHCERGFQAKDPEGKNTFTMCCTLRCYRKLRGLHDPSTGREGANLKRGRKRPCLPLTREQSPQGVPPQDPLAG